jgi:hypothetical protein
VKGSGNFGNANTRALDIFSLSVLNAMVC